MSEASCTFSAKAQRPLTRHVWQDEREQVDGNRLAAWGRLVSARRKQTVERSFADAKQLFGHRYAHFRGLVRVKLQCLLAAIIQGIKSVALVTTPSPAGRRSAPSASTKALPEPPNAEHSPQNKAPPEFKNQTELISSLRAPIGAICMSSSLTPMACLYSALMARYPTAVDRAPSRIVRARRPNRSR